MTKEIFQDQHTIDNKSSFHHNSTGHILAVIYARKILIYPVISNKLLMCEFAGSNKQSTEIKN